MDKWIYDGLNSLYEYLYGSKKEEKSESDRAKQKDGK